MESLSDFFGEAAEELEDCFLLGEGGCELWLEVWTFAGGARGAA